ncbi:cytochrome P450 [Schizopora paradoxa]|uniref:Cytochrome P450 n=1 Tax=Schizopora paradoxa TaxID=27342 RepID=A0A0H2RIP5_9AGAM|nr:cytochrome P450 [Schizopora paradoxa]
MFDGNMNSLITNIGIVSASFLIFRIIEISYSRTKRPPYPPGPKRLPLIGNLLQIPPSHLWEKAVEWRKEYGDLIYLESLGQRMLLVNSYEHAMELLANRSAIYSSRPHLTMAVDLEGWIWATGFTPYGDNFRKHRSYQQRFIGSPETLNYLEAQISETRNMLKNILEDTENYGTYVQSLPGSVILMNVYGHRVEKNDRYVDIGQRGVQYASDAEQYMFLDVFPWLKYIPEWFPWTKFHKVAKEVKKVQHAMRYDLYQVSKEKAANGILKECMTSIFLSENTRGDGSIADEDNFSAAAATLYMGGVDTSVTAIMSFVMQMLKNPNVQRKAQEEIEVVVGADRLPYFEDMENLPYVRAVCAEVLRHAAIATLIIPHSSTKDDVFNGYFIPQGTIVLANAWAMAFNPEYFPDPHAFKPERWLSSTSGKETKGPRSTDFGFGFGRRACPGRDWAQSLLFIAASSILATFNIEKAIGEDANPIEPNEEYYPGFIRQLGPSKCKFIPRSPRMVSLVKSYVNGNEV